MLILIPGITGNIGQHLAREALAREHEVRGLGRSSDKLDRKIWKNIESFVQVQSYYDIAAIDRACVGIDAVVVAYSGKPELQLDGQLILLRAAERAGVKRFHAASWNCYWPNLRLGEHEMMDNYLSFARQAELSSPIKPIYLFTGVLTEVFFSLPGHGDFSPGNNGIWDPKERKIVCWGTGAETWNFTTERDAASYSMDLISRDGAEDGGFFKVHSGIYTLKDVQAIYENVRACKITMQILGSAEDLEKAALNARLEGNARECWKYIGLFYQLLTLQRRWMWMEQETVASNVERTSLERWLQDHPEA